MKKLIILVVLSLSVSAFAQKSEVMKKLNEYNFSSKLVTTNLKDSDAEHFFDAKITTINSNETVVEKAKFDPTKEVGHKWILLSVNGEEPSKHDLKKFDKAHNTTQDGINGTVDDDAWTIEKDDANYLVIGLKYNKASLPKKYAFLGDCKGLAFFNKKTNRLEKAEFVNEGPIKIKMFNVTNLDMVVTYLYNEKEDTYFIEKEELDLDVNILDQNVKIKEISEYSNYKKM